MARRRGFTLIELLVVIAIIAVLIALLVPAVQKVREAANRAKCLNNLKQMALAAHNYESNYQTFPPGASPYPGGGITSRASVQVLILPFVEQANKYVQFDFTQDVNSGAGNAQARLQDVPIYICPSDPSPARFTQGYGRSNYFGNMGISAYAPANENPGVGGLFYYEVRDTQQPGETPKSVKPGDVPDGLSNTAMFAEVKRGWGTGSGGRVHLWDAMIVSSGWSSDTSPFAACNAATGSSLRYTGLQYYRNLITTSLYTHTALPNAPTGDCIDGSTRTGDLGGFFAAHVAPRSYHPAGVCMAFADGSVHFIRDGINPAVWRVLGARADGNVVNHGDL